MNTINNNLIIISAILTIIFGLFLATPAYAIGKTYNVGVIFNPYPDSMYANNNTSNNNQNNGASNENINTNTNSTNSNTNRTVNSSNNTYTSSNTMTTRNFDNTASNTNRTNSDVNVSDNNESYGSLTANALFGSNSFMPSGLVQWTIFAIIVALIIFLYRYVHGSKEKYMASPMKHA